MSDNGIEDAEITHQVIYQEPPTNAISEDGQRLRSALVKFWFSVEERTGTKNVKFGMSFDIPFGHETRVSLPLVENPTMPTPEDCVSPEQIALAIRSAYRIYKLSIQEEEKEDA